MQELTGNMQESNSNQPIAAAGRGVPLWLLRTVWLFMAIGLPLLIAWDVSLNYLNGRIEQRKLSEIGIIWFFIELQSFWNPMFFNAFWHKK